MRIVMEAIVKKFPQISLWMEKVPISEIGKDEVLIKTRQTKFWDAAKVSVSIAEHLK